MKTYLEAKADYDLADSRWRAAKATWNQASQAYFAASRKVQEMEEAKATARRILKLYEDGTVARIQANGIPTAADLEREARKKEMKELDEFLGVF